MSAPVVDGVASPCNSVCRMDARTGWCEGCLRTLDEIADWPILSAAEKTALLERLAERGGGRR